jgi:translation initiation factor 1 (eIF-1/SUI1)
MRTVAESECELQKTISNTCACGNLCVSGDIECEGDQMDPFLYELTR